MARLTRTLTAAALAIAAFGASSTLPAWAQTGATSAPATVAAPAHAPQGHEARTHRADRPAHAHGTPKAERHAQHRAAQLERTKTLLQLQPKQLPAWEQYVKATTPAARAAQTPQQPRTDWRQLTTPQRLDMAQQHRQARTAAAQQRDQATRTFYASLNTAQQKAFDALPPQGHGPRHAGHKAAGPQHRGDRHHGMEHAHPGAQPAAHRGGPSQPAAPAA